MVIFGVYIDIPLEKKHYGSGGGLANFHKFSNFRKYRWCRNYAYMIWAVFQRWFWYWGQIWSHLIHFLLTGTISHFEIEGLSSSSTQQILLNYWIELKIVLLSCISYGLDFLLEWKQVWKCSIESTASLDSWNTAYVLDEIKIAWFVDNYQIRSVTPMPDLLPSDFWNAL